MTYKQTLRGLAKTLNDIAALNPAEAMVRLGELTNTSTGELLRDLRAARVDAATRAVKAAGTQGALAEQLGVSAMAVSRALRAERSPSHPHD
jgi:hypothetical protein